MVDAICSEIYLQQNYFGNNKVLQTIYFGGGTPSLLTEKELSQIIATIHQCFTVEKDAEITLEANPDDLDKAKLMQLKRAGINRLSIGIQSFAEVHLRYMNRAHSAAEAATCVKIAQDIGFQNITVDLIYAIPADSHGILITDLQKAIALEVPHISAYCLTIEPKTVFGTWQKKGKIPAINEEFAAQQFEILIDTLTENHYQHYEISNFAKPNHYSRHNTNYWKAGSYLGIGASAHSYNGESRQANIANNAAYIKAVQQQKIPYEKEELSKADHINEYMMISLRTMWGCDMRILKEKYNYSLLDDLKNAQKIKDYQVRELLFIENQKIILTRKGKLLADEIAGNLFI